ncbi:flavin reductase [Actinoplanes sp. SE50]|uniref:flavin reductase family protein n=1 Tax=unclassified Actinoplanes TaxID=2626549 RepID=UPI00023EC170|nr:MULTISPECIES: flavin reductase family protein [unclassified Actinoplanes]AEV86963.1 flavin reductase domain-containing protein [Actinoplanes sp. SE50/110]ATO85359.1 flavin reductase [Actinoplanes sp. SE50]SLM02771.1 flavin reductase [Actinoplanes sp. SE50/110]
MAAGLTERTSIAGFREAMASFPSGVTIVTTTDQDGHWCGFTATSFCSLSMDPPLVLVCLARTARCHPGFRTARSWVIHTLTPGQAGLAMRFADRTADKFGGGEFVANAQGHPVLPGACAIVECDAYSQHEAGDHTILIGRVTAARVQAAEPAVYFRRGFRELSS